MGCSAPHIKEVADIDPKLASRWRACSFIKNDRTQLLVVVVVVLIGLQTQLFYHPLAMVCVHKPSHHGLMQLQLNP